MNVTRHIDVSASGQRRKQIEFLKNETNLVPPDSRKFAVIHSGNFITIDEHFAGGRLGHRTENMHQRGFAAS